MAMIKEEYAAEIGNAKVAEALEFEIACIMTTDRIFVNAPASKKMRKAKVAEFNESSMVPPVYENSGLYV